MPTSSTCRDTLSLTPSNFANGGVAPRPSARVVSTPRRESHGRGRPRQPPRPLLLPPLRSPRYRSPATVAGRSLLGLLHYDLCPLLSTRQLHRQGLTPLTTLVNCTSLIPLRDFRMPTGSENTRLQRRVMPRCATPRSAGRRSRHPTPCRVTLRTSVPSFPIPMS